MAQYKVASRFSYDDNRTFVREHVIVAEKKIGHKLTNGEVVHHIGRNKFNNDPSNLMIFASNTDHSAFHKGVPIYEENGVWKANFDSRKYTCQECGKQFVSKFRRQNKRIFCSYECANKAQRRIKNFSKDELFNLIIQEKGNFLSVGRILGITDNAVRKHCKRLGIPYHSMEYRKLLHGALAQSEEHRICNPEAEGA